jgi:uncharacterized protein YbcI
MQATTSGGTPLSSGQLGAAIANELGKMISDFVGRGATRSRAFVHNDVVVLLLEDGATRAEVNLVAAGRAELVRQARDALQRAMEDDLVAAVERLTGRTVRTFISGLSTEGESAVEVFVLEPDVSGPGSDAGLDLSGLPATVYEGKGSDGSPILRAKPHDIAT